MLSFYVSGSPGFVFLNPLSLATDDSRSVLAVKGSLRRFAPWTAAGRSGRRGCLRGKGDGWAWLSGFSGPCLPGRRLQRVVGLGSYQTAWTWLHKHGEGEGPVEEAPGGLAQTPVETLC